MLRHWSKKKDAFITTRTGIKRRRDNTKGVKVHVQRKHGSTTGVAPKDMKNSYYVQISEYVVQCQISGNPVFTWLIRHFFAKRNRFIGKLSFRYWFCTQKFGIKIPKSVNEAKAFYE